MKYFSTISLPVFAKTSGKYHHFQVKCYVFKGPATIMRSHRNRTSSLMGENGKGNCGKMLHFIEHLNVRGKWGVIGRTLPQYITQYNDGSWGLVSAKGIMPVCSCFFLKWNTLKNVFKKVKCRYTACIQNRGTHSKTCGKYTRTVKKGIHARWKRGKIRLSWNSIIKNHELLFDFSRTRY